MRYSTITQITIGSETDNVCNGDVIKLGLMDDGGGLYLTLEQTNEDDSVSQVRIDLEEWPFVMAAIDSLISQPMVK